MKRHGQLFDHIVAFDNILLAAHKASRGKKHNLRVSYFYFHLERECLALQEELVAGVYQPRPYRFFTIHHPKHRDICAADFRDRVVHHAICQQLEPIFENSLIFDTYACRPGKGAVAAVARAQSLARRYRYFLKCDVRRYFASIDHAVLQRLLVRKFREQRLLDLLSRIIRYPLPGAEPGCGLPIGNLTSQHFANFYLGELDHFIKEHRRVKGYLRYMDDMLLFGCNKEALWGELTEIRGVLRDVLQLELKDSAQVLAPISIGIPFLGLQIFPNLIRLQGKTRARLCRGVRRQERAYRKGLISLEELIGSITSRVGHAGHADTHHLRQALFYSSMDIG